MSVLCRIRVLRLLSNLCLMAKSNKFSSLTLMVRLCSNFLISVKFGIVIILCELVVYWPWAEPLIYLGTHLIYARKMSPFFDPDGKMHVSWMMHLVYLGTHLIYARLSWMNNVVHPLVQYPFHYFNSKTRSYYY
jgi:hypothetical protein